VAQADRAQLRNLEAAGRLDDVVERVRALVAELLRVGERAHPQRIEHEQEHAALHATVRQARGRASAFWMVARTCPSSSSTQVLPKSRSSRSRSENS